MPYAEDCAMGKARIEGAGDAILEAAKTLGRSAKLGPSGVSGAAVVRGVAAELCETSGNGWVGACASWLFVLELALAGSNHAMASTVRKIPSSSQNEDDPISKKSRVVKMCQDRAKQQAAVVLLMKTKPHSTGRGIV